MSPVKELIGKFEQRLAKPATRILPVDHRLEIAPQVRPTQLPTFDPGVGRPAVGSEHTVVVLTEHLADDFRAPCSSNGEHGGDLRHRNPEPRLAAILPPGCFISTRVLLANVLA